MPTGIAIPFTINFVVSMGVWCMWLWGLEVLVNEISIGIGFCIGFDIQWVWTHHCRSVCVQGANNLAKRVGCLEVLVRKCFAAPDGWFETVATEFWVLVFVLLCFCFCLRFCFLFAILLVFDLQICLKYAGQPLNSYFPTTK